MSHYCSSYPKLGIGVRAGTRIYDLSFFTRSLACITELYSLFYVNGVKVIPHNIYELLTPVALAHLIMGDGSAQGRALTICTDSYSIPEIVNLINVLIIRYRLNCKLRYHSPTQPRIFIYQDSMEKLRKIVSPFMHKSMIYKIETQLKIESAKYKKKILITNLVSGEIVKYRSLRQAAKELNTTHVTLRKYMINKKNYLGKYRIEILPTN